MNLAAQIYGGIVRKMSALIVVTMLVVTSAAMASKPRLAWPAEVECDLTSGKWKSGPARFNINCSELGTKISGAVPNEMNFRNVTYEVTTRDGSKKNVTLSVIDLCTSENETLDCLLQKTPQEINDKIAKRLQINATDVIGTKETQLGFPSRDRILVFKGNPESIPLKQDSSIDWRKVDGNSVSQLPGMATLRNEAGDERMFPDGKYRICVAGGPPVKQTVQKEDPGIRGGASCVYDNANMSYASLACPTREINLCVYPEGTCYIVEETGSTGREHPLSKAFNNNKLVKDTSMSAGMASCMSESLSTCKPYDSCVFDSMVAVGTSFVAPSSNLAKADATYQLNSKSSQEKAGEAQ
jgi:hypothetical protein